MGKGKVRLLGPGEVSGKPGSTIFEVKDAAAVRGCGGARGVQEQRTHEHGAAGRDRADDLGRAIA
jgi:hypothetical protein